MARRGGPGLNRSLKLLGSAGLHLIVLWTWIALLGFKWGTAPPMGRFMSPFEGFWRNAEIRAPRSAEVTVPFLSGTVVAEYDRRGVPHVFAQDLYGMFFAQGFATARDRLWQMDIQSRAGAGRLAEILGPGLLRFDLERRRMGMAAAAGAALDKISQDSLSEVALEAYADGVNAWIGSLTPATYPLEFKLLDYAPEAWTPLKSVVMLKNMQWTLSQGYDDAPLTEVFDKFGKDAFAKLYPLRNPGAEPIFPDGVFSPPAGDSAGSNANPQAFERSQAEGASSVALAPNPRSDSLWPRPNRASGSNNFALAGERTRSGYPILANDPHLDLTLPSTWYEIQLKAGELNAYGASLPGLPGIVIGFTRGTAWGLTNGMDDVYDWYRLKFRNDSLNQYLWNGRWRSAYRVLDTIPVRWRKAVVDTQLWTHIGPVPVRAGEVPFGRNTPPLHALRWLALDPSNEIGVFLRLMTAQGTADFHRAAKDLRVPSSNLLFADRDDIAMIHQGRLPIKKPGQGRTILTGMNASQEWSGYIPAALLPSADNPARGWLASANQEAAGEDYPYYLGSGFYPPERSQRLNRLLQTTRSGTLSAAWDIMQDDYSMLAARALPLLLQHLDTAGFSPRSKRAAELLRGWDYRYDADARAPVLFDAWWKSFYRRTWVDDFEGDSVRYEWPSRPVTLGLLASDTLSQWFDDIRTQKRETAGDLARAAFVDAVERSRPSPRDSGFVTWGKFHPLSIPHLLRLAPLGVAGMEGNGCAECLNAQRGSHGPSWRMAVQLGKRPLAWGIYPGGQTGNPGSPGYDAFVKDWLEGRSYPLLFLRWPLEAPDSTAYLLALRGKR